jgi:hypothetical protein
MMKLQAQPSRLLHEQKPLGILPKLMQWLPLQIWCKQDSIG